MMIHDILDARRMVGMTVLAGIALCLLPVRSGFSQSKTGKPPAIKKFQHSDTCPNECATCATAINKALGYLATIDTRQEKKLSSQVVVPLSLMGLAFMAEGSTHTEGKYAREIAKCIADVAAFQKPSREYTANVNWGMAATALFYAEVYSRKPDEKIKTTLKEIAQQLQNNQEKDGAWAHGIKVLSEYRSFSAATVFVMAALIRLKEVGCDVRDEAVEKGFQYLLRTMNREGSVTYDTVNIEKGYPSPALTAMALHLLMRSGRDPDQKPYTLWSAYLRKDIRKTIHYGHGSFHMNLLFAALGANAAKGETLQEYQEGFLDRLLTTQNAAGASRYMAEDTSDLSPMAFKKNKETGGSTQVGIGADDTYRTAIFALILQLPHGRLECFKTPASQPKK